MSSSPAPPASAPPPSSPPDGAPPYSPSKGSRIASAAVALILGAMLLVGVWSLWRVANHRHFQVDEAEHLHAAYNLRTGKIPYVDFYQIHPPLLHVMLYPGTDPADPESSYWRGRAVAGAVLLASILLCAGCAARLSNPLGGVLAAGLALSHTTLIERGIEVRPDNWVNLLLLGALFLELGDHRPKLRRYVVQGFLLGLGVLFSQKVAFPSFAFGCLWLFHAARARRPSWVLAPVLAWTVPVLVAAGVLHAYGAAQSAFQEIFGGAFDAASGAAYRETFGPMSYLEQECRRNVAFVLLGFFGLLRAVLDLVLPEGLRRRLGPALPVDSRRSLAFPAVLGLIMVASLWLNPFPWPYVHLGPAFVWAILGAALSAGIARANLGPVHSWKALLLAVAVLYAAAWTSAPRLADKGRHQVGLNNVGYQLFVLKELNRITEPDDAAFDLIGFYFRPDAYPAYNLSKDLIRWYERGAYPRIIDTLRENEAVALIHNYRRKWLPQKERSFIDQRFAQYFGNILLLGMDFRQCLTCEEGTELYFEALKTKSFRYDGPGEIEIDGKPFTRGVLTKGRHIVVLKNGAGKGRIIMETPPPYPPFPYDRLPPPGAMFVNPVGDDVFRLFD